MGSSLDSIQRERDQLALKIAEHNATAAVRESQFRSAFVAWLAISFGAALALMGGGVLAGMVPASSLVGKMAALAMLLGLVNVVVGYRRLLRSKKPL